MPDDLFRPQEFIQNMQEDLKQTKQDRVELLLLKQIKNFYYSSRMSAAATSWLIYTHHSIVSSGKEGIKNQKKSSIRCLLATCALTSATRGRRTSSATSWGWWWWWVAGQFSLMGRIASRKVGGEQTEAAAWSPSFAPPAMATKKLSSKSITKERELEESCANGTTTTAASSDDDDDLQAVFLCNTPPRPGLELGSQTLFFFFSTKHHISPPGMPQEWLHTEKKICKRELQRWCGRALSRIQPNL